MLAISWVCGYVEKGLEEVGVGGERRRGRCFKANRHPFVMSGG